MEHWFIKNRKADFSLIASQFRISETLARLIVNRNIKSNEELKNYLNPSMKHLHNPYALKDVENATSIIKDKITNRKKIRIVGDYDVDGVVSTYILLTALKVCGADADYEIPDRIKDGYGMNLSIVETAYKEGIDTILTCDNGIAAATQISRAKELGMTVIVTDHHDIPFQEESGFKIYQIPDADAVVNPKQEDCTYPFKGLCGAAVAYKFIEVLYDNYKITKSEATKFIEFVAIATVCDVMDLVDENRSIVACGLEMINNTSHVGLTALVSETGLLDKNIGVYQLGFIIGPCINASGRLETAKIGLELLLSQDIKTANKLAHKLKVLNDERKELTKEGFQKAIDIINLNGISNDKVLVVFLPDCHESLAGIIAGRIKEKYNKPVICLTNSETFIKGSARSIPEYNMFEELNKCKDILLKFGGHPMAAGLSLEESQVDVLRTRLNQNTTLTEKDITRKVSFDMVLPFQEINLNLIEEINRLEPYGKGNEKPLFALKDVKVTKATLLGTNKNALRLNVREKNYSFTALLFQKINEFEELLIERYGEETLHAIFEGRDTDVSLDFVFYPEINEYKGYKNIQIMVQYFR